MAYAGRNERQRELEKLYNRMCGRHSRYEVWQDAVWMIACSISNAVDKRYFDQREAQYMRTIQKYDKKELDAFPDFFANVVLGMEEHPDCDFLGELYMGLDLGNDRAGQFFTPYHVCSLMAQTTINDEMLKSKIDQQGWISINDCACGAGATLVAAANHLRSVGINYHTEALFVAQDIDATVALMCYIQLSLLGCAGYVKVGNTLTEPMTGNILFGDEKATTWYMPMYFHTVWNTRRAIFTAKSIFQRVATAIPGDANDQPADNMGDIESPEIALEEPANKTAQDESTPTFTISTRKKNAGQIMFDFG